MVQPFLKDWYVIKDNMWAESISSYGEYYYKL